MPINIILNKQNDDDNPLFPSITEQEINQADWEDGKLAIDLHETDDEITLVTAIAGVEQKDLEVFLHNDMLTVRGTRHHCEENKGHHLVRECHWGSFSRSVILPTDIDADSINAVLKDGILTVKMQKIERNKKIKVSKE